MEKAKKKLGGKKLKYFVIVIEFKIKFVGVIGLEESSKKFIKSINY